MKKTLVNMFVGTFCILNSSFAQIPNSGFENWTNMGSYDNPDDWGTMNNTTASGSIFTATKGTPGSPGTAYLNLTSKLVGGSVVNGIAVSGKLDSISKQPISGFAFNQQPQKFTGKWQHMIYGTSQGSISVKLTRWNTSTNTRETIANANKTLTGMAMSWAAFTINFVYLSANIPDTCIIVLKASGITPTVDDYLWVDNLAFTGTVTGIDVQKNFLNNMEIYPNPCSQNINVNVNLIYSGQTTFEILDLTGKVVLSKTTTLPLGESSETIDISNLPKGFYIVRLISESGIETSKISIE